MLKKLALVHLPNIDRESGDDNIVTAIALIKGPAIVIDILLLLHLEQSLLNGVSVPIIRSAEGGVLLHVGGVHVVIHHGVIGNLDQVISRSQISVRIGAGLLT